MTPETETEKLAIIHGGSMAGEYIKSIGKTDLATLTKSEWQEFCSIMCLNYHLALVESESQLSD